MTIALQDITSAARDQRRGIIGFTGISAAADGTTAYQLDITVSAGAYAVLADGTFLDAALGLVTTTALPPYASATYTDGSYTLWLDHDAVYAPVWSISAAAPSDNALNIAAVTVGSHVISAVTTGTWGVPTGTVTPSTSALITPTASKAAAAGSVWDGFKVAAATATLTGQTTVATASGFNTAVIKGGTITDTDAETVSYAATLAIEKAPTAGGSITITNAFALWVQAGLTKLAGGLTVVGTTTLAATNVTGTVAITGAVGLTGTTTQTGPLIKAVTVVAALALDVTLGPSYTKSIATDSTFTASAAGTAGQEITLIIATDGTQRVATFGTNLNSSGTLTIPANKKGTWTGLSDGTAFRETGRAILL